jgi:hypothetical protein
VPIGGAYRLIDVPMSNCINSGISKIYVLTQFNSTSLNRHLARTYNLGSGVRFGGDGFVEVLAATQTPTDKEWFQGTADAVRQYTWLFEDIKNRVVQDIIILSGDHLCAAPRPPPPCTEPVALCAGEPARPVHVLASACLSGLNLRGSQGRRTEAAGLAVTRTLEAQGLGLLTGVACQGRRRTAAGVLACSHTSCHAERGGGAARYRMDYLKFVEHHRATNADITIGCLPVDYERASDFGLMKVNDEGEIFVRPIRPPAVRAPLRAAAPAAQPACRRVRSPSRAWVPSAAAAGAALACLTERRAPGRQDFSEKPKGAALEEMKVDTTLLGARGAGGGPKPAPSHS